MDFLYFLEETSTLPIRTKKGLRAEILKRLGSFNSQQLEIKSLRIKDKLFSLEAFQKAKCVCFYVSLPLEVDTKGMIEEALAQGKRVLVPLTNLENKELSLYGITNRHTDLKKGAFGVMEPRPDKTPAARLSDVECLIVPGIVFDKKCHRIGHGGGYYDRFLKQLPPQVLTIGLAFSLQVVQEIPTEAHDVKLGMVLTD